MLNSEPMKAPDWVPPKKDQMRIYSKVNQAIIDRVIKKECKCSNCGRETSTVQAHHDDYNKPLEVIWLCSSCHQLVHSRNVEELQRRRWEYEITGVGRKRNYGETLRDTDIDYGI